MITFFLISCSKSSKEIVGLYVSPLQYADYSCDQMITGAGLIIFWPALFFIGGTKEQETEYARLKGEYEALDKMTIKKIVL